MKKTYKFKMEPWEHQRRALMESWDEEYWALLFEYGCGKTKVIIDTAAIQYEIENKIDALFIIAPNEVHVQWIDEQVPEHLPDRIPYIARIWTGNNSAKYKRTLEEFWAEKNDEKLKIFSMNVEALQSSERARAMAIHFLKSFNCLLTVDESTRIKTPGAKRSKFITNRLSKLAYMRRTLTGNEVTRSPFDVYMPYNFLKNKFWDTTYQVFKHRYAEFKKMGFYQKDMKIKNFNCKGPTRAKPPTILPFVPPQSKPVIEKLNLKRMGEKVFPSCPSCNAVVSYNCLPWNIKRVVDAGGKNEFEKVISYRNLDKLVAITQKCSTLVRKKDCMDLPEKIMQPIFCEMNSEQKRIYMELKKNLYTEYQGEPLEVLHKIALRTRFRQIVGGFFPITGEPIGKSNPKIDRMLYDLEDIDTDSPIIIWASFTAEIRGIHLALKNVKEYKGKRIVKFFGDTPKPERKQIIRDFRAGEIDYFIANPSVAGTGLNLQRAYINYYFSNDDRSENRWQSEDRTHRGGQTHDCLYKDIYMPGTIDDVIKKSHQEKKDIAEYFKSNRIEDFLEMV